MLRVPDLATAAAGASRSTNFHSLVFSNRGVGVAPGEVILQPVRPGLRNSEIPLAHSVCIVNVSVHYDEGERDI